jgi:hypothetical protein
MMTDQEVERAAASEFEKLCRIIAVLYEPGAGETLTEDELELCKFARKEWSVGGKYWLTEFLRSQVRKIEEAYTEATKTEDHEKAKTIELRIIEETLAVIDRYKRDAELERRLCELLDLLGSVLREAMKGNLRFTVDEFVKPGTGSIEESKEDCGCCVEEGKR